MAYCNFFLFKQSHICTTLHTAGALPGHGPLQKRAQAARRAPRAPSTGQGAHRIAAAWGCSTGARSLLIPAAILWTMLLSPLHKRGNQGSGRLGDSPRRTEGSLAEDQPLHQLPLNSSRGPVTSPEPPLPWPIVPMHLLIPHSALCLTNPRSGKQLNQ